jgi:hypothetical protein
VDVSRFKLMSTMLQAMVALECAFDVRVDFDSLIIQCICSGEGETAMDAMRFLVRNWQRLDLNAALET